MRILYIAAENVSGTLNLFKAEHNRRGDDCRYVTFWHSRWDFADDICLRLPFMPNRPWVRYLRRQVAVDRFGSETSAHEGVPDWRPGWMGRRLFAWRDAVLWPRISQAIRTYGLDEFDIIHLDGGLDFTRDARFAREQSRQGKRIVCFYHGTDLRNRGLIRAVDDLAELRLTSEWDLLEVDPRLRYLYLPLDTSAFEVRPYRFHRPIRICHAARNPYKGSAFVEASVRELSDRYSVELILLKDTPHGEALQRMQESDIFVDQLTNAGGWGYGMSSVEALAMGMPVVTNIPDSIAGKLDDHPFVQADTKSIRDVLRQLIENERRCRELAEAGRAWVKQRHDIRRVADQLYAYYEEMGWRSRPSPSA